MPGDIQYREGLEGFPGHLAAGRLLVKHSTFGGAWKGLEIFSLEDAEGWLKDPVIRVCHRRELAPRVDGAIQVAIQFAMVAVMADRERRRDDEELQTRVKDSGEDS